MHWYVLKYRKALICLKPKYFIGRYLNICSISNRRPRWLSGEKSTYQCRRYGFDPSVRRSPRGENGSLLHCSCLENPMDREGWQATVHGVAESQTWLSTCTHTVKAVGMVRWWASLEQWLCGDREGIGIENECATLSPWSLLSNLGGGHMGIHYVIVHIFCMPEILLIFCPFFSSDNPWNL